MDQINTVYENLRVKKFPSEKTNALDKMNKLLDR